jgi:hypothetical protein
MAQAKPRLSSDAGPQFEEATREALDALRRAADEWAEGDPEQPPTREVLGRVLQPFLDRKFLRRPF